VISATATPPSFGRAEYRGDIAVDPNGDAAEPAEKTFSALRGQEREAGETLFLREPGFHVCSSIE